ncbi:helix-turn-helix transcriptional regulator [Salinisphaera sp. SWV1]|uniref:helix-turn-helix transcriptional regulator n=1 Tax=Salinisphaera sp. SWV1 TaxID=3454139 RepID=UPI003F83FD28
MAEANLSGCYVSEHKVAEFFGVSVKTVQAWRHRGNGPRFAKFGRAVRYNVNELQEWAESRQHTSTASVSAGGVE